MIKLTLPDNSVREIESAQSAAEVIKGIGLLHVARKSVEEHTAVALCYGVVDHLDHDVIAHQLSGIHDALDAFAQLRLVGNLLAQQVARRDVRQTVFLHDEVALGAFAGPRRSENNNIFHDCLNV